MSKEISIDALVEQAKTELVEEKKEMMVETIKTRLREIEAAKFTLSKLEESYNKMLVKLDDALKLIGV